jgi:cell division protein FtsB
LGIVNVLQGMKKILGKIGVYAIWGLILILALSVARNVSRDAQINAQIKAEKAKLAKIQADNNKLIQELTQTQNPNFIEKEVRDKLGLGKTGEAMVVLPDEETLRKLAPQMPVEIDTLPDPNWGKWEKLFF